MLVRCSSRVRIGIILTLITWLAASPHASAQPKDTLYFFNNARIVGKLRSVKLGYFEIDADGFGIVRIKNNKISSLHAQWRNYRVETSSDSILYGVFTRDLKPGWTMVHTLEKSTAIRV